ncbi:MAG: DedA family protein [Terriglobales bacterium]
MHWLIHSVRYWLETYGYWAVAVTLLGENAGIPLPGETILLLASFLAYRGEPLSLPWLILVGTCACTLGDNLGYWIGRRGGRPLLERWKNWFHIRSEDITAGEEFLARRGAPAIFLARFIAGMRIVAGPLAGVLHMPWRKFFLANATGAATWVTAICLVGYSFGGRFRTLLGLMKRVELVVFVLAAAGVVYLIYRRHKRVNHSGRGRESEPF